MIKLKVLYFSQIYSAPPFQRWRCDKVEYQISYSVKYGAWAIEQDWKGVIFNVPRERGVRAFFKKQGYSIRLQGWRGEGVPSPPSKTLKELRQETAGTLQEFLESPPRNDRGRQRIRNTKLRLPTIKFRLESCCPGYVSWQSEDGLVLITHTFDVLPPTSAWAIRTRERQIYKKNLRGVESYFRQLGNTVQLEIIKGFKSNMKFDETTTNKSSVSSILTVRKRKLIFGK